MWQPHSPSDSLGTRIDYTREMTNLPAVVTVSRPDAEEIGDHHTVFDGNAQVYKHRWIGVVVIVRDSLPRPIFSAKQFL